MIRVAIVLLSTFVSALAFAQPSYFVQADMVRGAEGAMGAVCVPNSVFVPGEKIIFRAAVFDAATGEELDFAEIQERGIEATVTMDGQEIAMFFPPPEEGTPAGAGYFRGPFPIPADYAAGMYDWNVEITDAEGATAAASPIGAAIGANSVTIQPAN